MRRHKLMTAEDRKHLPELRSTDGQSFHAVAWVKLFWGSSTSFYVTEFDGDDTLYGWTETGDPSTSEWGYGSLSELASARNPVCFGGIPAVERDLAFDPGKVGDVAGSEVPA
jgi:hypothetical protein